MACGVGRGVNLKAVDLSCSIAGVRFANPVIAASGTFGYGSYKEKPVPMMQNLL